MIRWRQGTVRQLLGGWQGSVECLVEIITDDAETPVELRALAYPDLVGPIEVGDRVLVNTTALDAGLGTGGYAFVIAGVRPPTLPAPGPGHIVKARYTPQQVMVLAVDEPASPHHDLLREADDLGGMPVVIADLHSSLPAVIAGAMSETEILNRTPRIVYVMTDGAALPVWFSRTVAGLREAKLIQASITTGQAFGGDLEAVTLHSALLAARLVLDADLVVVTPGPGVAGTGSRWGFSGVGVGEAINATATLGGRPIAVLRVSAADARERHRGISHHSLTALSRVALAPADVVLANLEGDYAELAALIRQQALPLAAASPRPPGDRSVSNPVPPAGRHRLVEIESCGLIEALQASPIPLATMGRGLQQDTPAFVTAAAAGRHAVRLIAP